MMTYNEQRSGQKDFDSSRFYNPAYSGQQQFIQNTSSAYYPNSSNPPMHHSLNQPSWLQSYHMQPLLQPLQQLLPQSAIGGVSQAPVQQYPQMIQSQHMPFQNPQYFQQAAPDVFGTNQVLAGPLHSGQMQPNLAQPGQVPNTSFHQGETGGLHSQISPINQGPVPQMGQLDNTNSMGMIPMMVRGPNSNLTLIEQLQMELPVPPLSKAPTRPDVSFLNSQRRPKRKSKFTKLQDSIIVRLKKEGRLWVEIADLAGVGSYLAARNRYQVIVGQQGNNNSLSWTVEDRNQLQQLLDSAEMEKWRYIALELYKATGKCYTLAEVREFTRQMFWQNPLAMGVNEKLVEELQKEKKITERLIQQAGGTDQLNYVRRRASSPELAM